MTTNTDTDRPIDMTASIDRRLAAIRADAARTTIMPDRPTDTSRNGMRGARTQRRRIIR